MRRKVVYEAEFKTDQAEQNSEKLGNSFKKTGETAKKTSKDASDGMDDTAKATEGATNAADKLTGGLITGFRSAISGIKTGVAAMKTFRGALISTGIGALLVALGSLVSFLTKTQRGAELLDRVTAGLGATIDVLTDRFSAFGETIIGAFQDPQQAIKDFGNLIVDFVMNRVNDVINGFTGLGKTVKLIFEGEFKQAFETGKQAAQDLVTGLVPVAGAIKDNADAIGDIAKEISNESSAAFELTKRMQDLERQEIAFIKTKAEKRAAIEAARLAAEDETKSDEQRAEALQRAIDIQTELTDKEIAFAKERADIITQQVALGESLNEDLENEAQAQATVIDLEAQRDRQLRSLQTRLNAFTKDQKENTDAKKEDLEAEKERIEAEKLLADLRIANIVNEDERELAQLDLKFQKMREKAKGNEELITEIDKRYTQEREKFTQEAEAKTEEERKKAHQQELARAEAEKNAKIQLAQSVLSATSSFLEQGSDAAKAVAVAQTTIDTYRSATAAFASVTSVAGPIAGGIAAAAAVAAGIANVRKILQTNPQVSGGGAAPSAGEQGIGGALGGGVPNITAGQRQEATNVDPQEALRRQQNADNLPIQAYVLEGNITNSQEAQRQLENSARL